MPGIGAGSSSSCHDQRRTGLMHHGRNERYTLSTENNWGQKFDSDLTR